MSKAYKYGNSNFWLGKYDNYIDNQLLSDSEKQTQNLYKLAAQKRAISNFVSIVTSKEIPIKFATNGDSYTDGKSVVISSKIEEPEDFDPAVGLALHEGSHILLSDFKLLRELEMEIRKLPNFVQISEKATEVRINIIHILKDILNVVEDRRIDNFVYSSSPGYRSYYTALYDKFFNDKIIDKGMQSEEYTDETIASYMFRLINIHSKYSRLDALKGLRAIYKLLDLPNIGRLKTTKDSFEVAVGIFEIILNNIYANPENFKKPEPQNGENGENGEQSGEGEQNGQNGEQQSGDESSEGSESSMRGDSPMGGDSDEDSAGGSSIGGTPSAGGKKTKSSKGSKNSNELSDKQKSLLDKKIQKQKDFLKGDVKKTKLSKTAAQTIEVIAKASADVKTVGTEFHSPRFPNSKTECIFVKNMTNELMNDTSFPLTHTGYDYTTKTVGLIESCTKSVEQGIKLGTILGKKLQVRSESRDTIFNRQLIGKLDRRMISALGFGNEHVFFTKETDKYNKANLHISVDASGSMGGTKWDKTMVNVVALAKAVDMINNLDIQITFRTTTNGDGIPYIVLAYDSRKDKFTKVKSLFKYLRPNGTTPEGLCFEAIMDYMVESNRNIDSYFLNISDGEPYYYGREIQYAGKEAARHTRKMVDRIKGMGIKILSYFVTDMSVMNYNTQATQIFRESYGNSANFINVTSVVEVSKTMNRLFLQK